MRMPSWYDLKTVKETLNLNTNKQNIFICDFCVYFQLLEKLDISLILIINIQKI